MSPVKMIVLAYAAKRPAVWVPRMPGRMHTPSRVAKGTGAILLLRGCGVMLGSIHDDNDIVDVAADCFFLFLSPVFLFLVVVLGADAFFPRPAFFCCVRAFFILIFFFLSLSFVGVFSSSPPKFRWLASRVTSSDTTRPYDSEGAGIRPP